ncbi:DMT family transporter [Zhihengliuella halotolerans]|uniref:Small multidrug resistance pump n=1 Tax=Zhihengliuella halotolerans TaxID=370736 RepID=A0A4Q8AGJ0_9MICC|nr:SMR family transporter [Zhihengliuella halotolerans]RZU62779.1 small multidrug resistance pump [Zhihengliuella halotolerans]
MKKWILLAVAVVAEVTATLCLKGALEQPLLYGVVAAGYIAAFALLGRVLRAGMPLGVAYGLWSAAGVVLTALAAAVVFSEPITLLMACGFVLVIGGVLLVELGHQRAMPRTRTHPPGDGAHEVTP